MRRKLLSILVLSILVASTLVGCSQPCTLTIFSITGGNVSVMKAGASEWIEGEVGMSLEVGDTIKCGDNSSAGITFVDGSTIELQALTEIEVASLGTTDTGSATIVVRQTIGNIIFRVTKIIDPASRYEVETPAGVVAIRGSAVEVYVIEDGTTWATNLEGDIWAAAQGVELQVPEGGQCIIRPEQPPELIIGIWDWYDLDDISNNLSGSYVMMNDLDSDTPGYEELAGPTANEGKGWEPIGTNETQFRGAFDGQRHEIRDLFIDRRDERTVGLFGFVDDDGAVISNLGVADVTVKGYYNVGSLIGYHARGTVSNCYATGSVSGQYWVGGLVGGTNLGVLISCYAVCNVTDSVWGAGGLLPGTYGTISNSYYNYDDVLINGENMITIGALFDQDFEEWLANSKFLDVSERLSKEGGYYAINNIDDFQQLLAFGQNASLKFRLKNDLDLSSEPGFYVPYLAGDFDGDGHEITNWTFFNSSFALDIGLFGVIGPSGSVTGLHVEGVDIAACSYVGCIAGASSGTVSDCYSTGSVISRVYGAGGLVGYGLRGSTVSNSYSSCNATARELAGGLIGYTFGEVSNCYATGSVTGNLAGGLVGNLRGTGSTVTNCYATGSVTGSEHVGGLVGLNEGGTVTMSFWDTQTSGQDTSAGGTGKTRAEMQDIGTFSGTTWSIIAVANPSMRNSAYIWNIVNGQTYPFLSWQAVF